MSAERILVCAESECRHVLACKRLPPHIQAFFTGTAAPTCTPSSNSGSDSPPAVPMANASQVKSGAADSGAKAAAPANVAAADAKAAVTSPADADADDSFSSLPPAN
jgi:hypothetical protein